MTPYLQTDRATLWHARAEEVYPLVAPGSVSMAWVDGPYAMRNAPWDMMNVDDLPAFYAPHYEALDRVLAPSATVYHWGTAEGWARVDPVIRGMGWTFRVLVTWNKTNPPSQKGQEMNTCWNDFTEVCGVYQRNAWDLDSGPAQMIGHAAGADEKNWIRHWLAAEWEESGLPRSAVDVAQGTATMGQRHYFARSQWFLPTWENYQKMAAYAAEHGAPRERPYLVHPAVLAGDLRGSYEHLRGEYEHLRGEYEQSRVAFTAPTGFTGNVWTSPVVPPSRRLKTAEGETHECEKPLAFADRAIRASTRPGDTIIDPFAGTNRIALACHRLLAEEARHAHGIEMDARWLDAIRPSLVADYSHVPKGQSALFGAR